MTLDAQKRIPYELAKHLRDANAHHRYVKTTTVDDTPVDGATTAPISSNWAFDHVAAADPHTGYVLESLFDAHTIIYAVSDNTPVALTVGASTIVGRKASGNIVALTGAELLAILTGQAGAAFSWNSQNLTNTGTIQAATSVWWSVQHMTGAGLNPGASGATLVTPSANSAGGYQINAVTEELFFDAHVHDDWDGATDLLVKVIFEVNVDNTAGSAGDTVDLRLQCFYKGNGETACRTQVLEVATVVGQSARYKQFTATFTIDWDLVANVVAASDDIGFILNLETDTSEVDDVIITHAAFEYKTKKVNPEV